MQATAKGAGEITTHRVNEAGQVLLRCWGRDEKSGSYTAFWATVSWGHWVRLEEQVYNDREEQAQERIPY